LLLKDSYRSFTSSVDNIISFYNDSKKGGTLDIVLNDDIRKQDSNCIHYSDGANEVFVLTTPIYISNSTADILKGYAATTNQFSYDGTKIGTNYTTIPSGNITMQKEDDIYIDCNPTGESNETIAQYSVPINSAYSNEKQSIDYANTAVHFALIAVGFIASYVIVPPFYKFIVIDKIVKLVTTNETAVHKRIKSADILITILVFVIFVSLLSSNFTSWALFILVFFGLHASIISMNKLYTTFMTVYKDDGSQYPNSPYTYSAADEKIKVMDYVNDFGEFLIHILTFIFTNCLIPILALWIILIVILIIVWAVGQISSLNMLISSMLVLFGIPVIVPIFVLVTK